MADVTDLFASVYDTLARTFNTASLPGSYFQFGWPGINLSPVDFKLSDAPGAPYDANAAEETFSLLCNIAPACSPVRFDNSGFEIDDLYQIVLLGAVPRGANPQNLPAFPSYKLFSDAQYELAQAQKGSNRDASVIYYPCRATPGDWYTEASAQHWPTLSLNAGQIRQATPDSPFIRLGGKKLIDQGVVKLVPAATNVGTIKAELQSHVARELQTQDLRSVPVAPVKPLTELRARALGRGLAVPVRVEESVARTRLIEAAASPAAKKDLRPIPAVARLPRLDGVDIDPERFDVVTAKTLTFDKKLLLRRYLGEQLVPAALNTTHFSISFKYCLVNITRNWFKNALLNLRTWYMISVPQGDYSSGTIDGNPGMFPMLPTSMLAIRDLRISASWSQADRATLRRTKYLGPFDVSAAEFNQDTLRSDGLQIIGWLSRLTPVLPPLSPPVE
ncbi:hypothetical protein [Stigmatella erecta]|uniref:Uncharacterized protein n=1 Tax=Stigmatella erecta TaxID=83460 RepID=A0A1I0KNB1_9BACT|nr:hypothetical protein [Stigmatella erecta]SEU26568.1 hypothetical protein SAMN05443639_112117 [Stigmatella erecta]